MVGLRGPRTPTDNRMVLVVIIGEGATRHYTYLKGRTTWPIQEEKGRTSQDGDSLFRDLKGRVKKPSRKDIAT